MQEVDFTPADLAGCIDHTLLDAGASKTDLAQICEEAREYGFKGVCVYPGHVGVVAGLLAGSGVLPISVAGFPSGTMSTPEKVDDALMAVASGAREIDMVLNREALQARAYHEVWTDIASVVAASAPWPVKVILETAALDDDGIRIACALSKAAGAAFVKTSTGFGPGGASEHAVRLMRETVGDDMGIKASGGIKNTSQAIAMIQAGADRIGASASLAIIGVK